MSVFKGFIIWHMRMKVPFTIKYLNSNNYDRFH